MPFPEPLHTKATSRGSIPIAAISSLNRIALSLVHPTSASNESKTTAPARAFISGSLTLDLGGSIVRGHFTVRNDPNIASTACRGRSAIFGGSGEPVENRRAGTGVADGDAPYHRCDDQRRAEDRGAVNAAESHAIVDHQTDRHPDLKGQE